MDLKETHILGDQIDKHWYYRAKSAALLRTLRNQPIREILDIGAGSGFFSRYLLTQTEAERAVCVDRAYHEDYDRTCEGKPILFRRTIDQSNADVVLLMDVLEHVDSERELLRPYIDAVERKARFVVTVPAFQFLWSGHDVFLEHRRRYTIKRLVTSLQQCGLVCDRCHYYYAFVFPIAAAMRLLERVARAPASKPKSQLRQESWCVNNALAIICAAERPIMCANHMFGLSIFGVFRKP